VAAIVVYVRGPKRHGGDVQVRILDAITEVELTSNPISGNTLHVCKGMRNLAVLQSKNKG